MNFVDVTNSFRVPESAQAVLWDMDGVLLDTLTLDFEIMGGLLAKYAPGHHGIDRDMIRSVFAYDPAKCWQIILDSDNVRLDDVTFKALVDEYEDIRRNTVAKCNAGIVDILKALPNFSIKAAVVSNNSSADVRRILANGGIENYFVEIVGNDLPGMKKKPAPDSYLEAMKRLDVVADSCVVVEDSLLGAQAGRAAGAFVIGVATGANSFEDLTTSDCVDVAVKSFGEQ